jgi:hypothetical protein
LKKTEQKATFKDLIAKKLQKEASLTVYKDLTIRSMGKTMTFKRPTDDQILDVMDEIGDGKDARKIAEAYKKLIYHTCSMLQDTELHKELEIKDPFDAVNAIFDLADVLELGDQLMDMTDIGSKVEKIKN